MDKIRALIVDDSSVMRKIVERSLRQAGIDLEKVVEAANGAEALAALQSNVVDLILCDINMPVMDGLEFVRQVATVETAKGVDIVILGNAWTVTPIAQAATPAFSAPCAWIRSGAPFAARYRANSRSPHSAKAAALREGRRGASTSASRRQVGTPSSSTRSFRPRPGATSPRRRSRGV